VWATSLLIVVTVDLYWNSATARGVTKTKYPAPWIFEIAGDYIRIIATVINAASHRFALVVQSILRSQLIHFHPLRDLTKSRAPFWPADSHFGLAASGRASVSCRHLVCFMAWAYVTQGNLSSMYGPFLGSEFSQSITFSRRVLNNPWRRRLACDSFETGSRRG
jgi:hypothetical protein